MTIDTTFDQNYKIIQARLDRAASESRRLFHGRGQCYLGWEWLSVDWFAPVILITSFADIEEDKLLSWFSPIFQNNNNVQAIVWQRRDTQIAKNKTLLGEVPKPLYAQEAGMRYTIDVLSKQNIGFFLDMRHGREWLAQHCKGKRVLNMFSFTCAFSVAALNAEAESVVNIDMGKGVLSRGQKNHQLNDLDKNRAHFLPHNIFKSWKKLHSLGRYDIIIIDPPSRQRGAFDAEKDYAKVIRRLSKLLKPKADILACLNAPYLDEAHLDNWVLENLEGVSKVRRLSNPPAFEDTNLDQALKVVHYHYEKDSEC